VQKVYVAPGNAGHGAGRPAWKISRSPHSGTESSSSNAKDIYMTVVARKRRWLRGSWMRSALRTENFRPDKSRRATGILQGFRQAFHDSPNIPTAFFETSATSPPRAPMS